MFPLFGLPLDMLRLIVAMLSRPDLGRFARVSRAARDLARHWFASAEYGRRLCRALSGAEPPGDLPGLYRRAYALGFRYYRGPHEIDGIGRTDRFLQLWSGPAGCSVSRVPPTGASRELAADLLEWAATLERGGLREEEPPRSRNPRREVLSMARRRLHLDIGAFVGDWKDGKRVAETVQDIAAKLLARFTRLLTRPRVLFNAPIMKRLSASLGGALSEAFRSEGLTEDQAVLLYCVWASHVIPGHNKGGSTGLQCRWISTNQDMGGVRQAAHAGLLYYDFMASLTDTTNMEMRLYDPHGKFGLPRAYYLGLPPL